MQPPRLVAFDSNVLLALAEEDDEAIDAWSVVRKRIRPAIIMVLPTVLREVGRQAADTRHAALQAVARKALQQLRLRWMLQPVQLRPDQTDVVGRAVRALWKSGLLPTAERNDALIVVEAAVLQCMLLVSQDSRLHGIDRGGLRQVLVKFDLTPPLIASPREIVKKFYR